MEKLTQGLNVIHKRKYNIFAYLHIFSIIVLKKWKSRKNNEKHVFTKCYLLTFKLFANSADVMFCNCRPVNKITVWMIQEIKREFNQLRPFRHRRPGNQGF